MKFRVLLAFLLAGIPSFASAHEVYVLPADVIQTALATPAFSEWQVILANTSQFLLYGFLAALTIVFFISISRVLERRFDPILAKLPRYAPVISRVTIGISLIAAGYNGALFGPELPLAGTFGPSAHAISLMLIVIGTMIVAGWHIRIAALAAAFIFLEEVLIHGSYMLTYANYAGEFIVLSVLGAHAIGFHTKHRDLRRFPAYALKLKERLTPFMFPLLRVVFGISLIYASLYAKVIHNNLALAVADAYPSLVAFFGFEPHFLVLGAAIIEVLIGLFFVFGIEIRFTSLFLLFWLSLSLAYFGEVVWPHIVLIGIPIAFICYGYDKYSLEGYFFKRGKREPVL